jgi:hypothetical protein
MADMPEPTPLEIVRWMGLASPSELPIIVIVVDDRDDDELVAIIARERDVPSPRFGGVWGGGRRDGRSVVALQLTDLDGGAERRWFTQDIRRELLEMILVVPHLVAIMPQEVAGDANSAESVIPRLGASLIAQVSSASPEVAEALRELGDA